MLDGEADARPVVQLRDVSKYYKLYASRQDRFKEALSLRGTAFHKQFSALSHVDLSVSKGEIIGIVGQNGSGKSTLLKLIAGVLVPDEGQIDIRGKVTALLELGGGFNPEFTGRENIFFYGTILGFSRQKMKSLEADIIAFADIGEHIDQPLRTYSSGMRARLGFAVAIHVDPEILILDEVLAVGDALFQRKCYAKMESLFQSGITIFYVSHNVNSIKEFCTRVIFIDKGEILLVGDPKSVVTQYQKYLFATEQTRKQLRASMKNHPLESAVSEQTNKSEAASECVVSKAQMLSTFRSECRQESVQFGASVSEIGVEDDEGNEVNMLPFDQPFVFRYTVTFDEQELPLQSVYFGMQIKDVKGINISGSNTQRLNTPTAVHNHVPYRVQWSFRTNLLPGDYFASVSVFLFHGDRKYHVKVIDAYAFKVFDDGVVPFAGKTYLGQRFSLKPIQGDVAAERSVD
jgi:lipopolysaccharide transport system ATP-binding protein